MNVDGFNYDVIGRSILIDIGASVTKSGIIKPDQAKDKDTLASDEALRIVSISNEGMDALSLSPEDVEDGFWIYLHPHCIPMFRFEKSGRRYALIEVQEIAAIAPDKFDRDLHLLEKAIEQERVREQIELNKRKIVESITKS